MFSPLIAGTMKWGVWGARFTTAQYREMIEHCLSVGINTFDHADIYGHYSTEAEFGAVLQEQPSLRHQIRIITKCGIKMMSPNRPSHQIKSYDTSAKHIRASVEQSLQNLKTDYLDCLLIHRPDPLMHADEVAEVITSLKAEGKILHFGVSNFKPHQLALLHSRITVEVNQVEISIRKLDAFLDGTLDQCQQEKIIPLAWSPLGGGNIFAASDDERNLRIIACAEILAEKYHTSSDIILLSWLLQHPTNIIPVLGTSKMERITAAVKALQIKPEREEWFMLWRASTGKEVP